MENISGDEEEEDLQISDEMCYTVLGLLPEKNFNVYFLDFFKVCVCDVQTFIGVI